MNCLEGRRCRQAVFFLEIGKEGLEEFRFATGMHVPEYVEQLDHAESLLIDKKGRFPKTFSGNLHPEGRPALELNSPGRRKLVERGIEERNQADERACMNEVLGFLQFLHTHFRRLSIVRIPSF